MLTMKKNIIFSIIIFGLLSSCTEILTPPLVKTVSASAQSSTTIGASGKILSASGSAILSYGLCISHDSLPNIGDTKKEHLSESFFPTDEFGDTFTGLNVNETYYVRAYAINSDGVAYGNSICVKTILGPGVTSSEATDITMTDATLIAIINPHNTNSENWFEYWIDGGLVQRLDAGNSSGNADVVITFKLKGLTPGKTYSFKAKSKNEFATTEGTTIKFETYSIADYDGNLYHTVSIGAQTWLRENLKTTHFANGDIIPNIQDPEAWPILLTGAYCRYNNDRKISDIYGLLYNWYVASDSRELIAGCHVPVSSDDWNMLVNNFGDYYSAGVKMLGISSGLWKNPSVSPVLTPYIGMSGFNALPNGAFYNDGLINKYIFMELNSTATYWSSDSFNGLGIPAIIESNGCYLSIGGLYDKECGFGLRLLKNK